MGILTSSFLRLDHAVENDLIAMEPLCRLVAAISNKWGVEICILTQETQRIDTESWGMHFDRFDRLDGILDAIRSEDFVDTRFEVTASNNDWLYCVEIMCDEVQLARLRECAIETHFFEVIADNTAKIEEVSAYIAESEFDAPSFRNAIWRWERNKAKQSEKRSSRQE